MIQILNEVKKITFVYTVWITIHYIAAHLYTYLCVPVSWYGFLMSPLMVTTPQCHGLRWIVYNGGVTITNMWLAIGTWIGALLLRK